MILQHDLFFLLYPTIPPNLRLKWQQICWSGLLIFHTFHAEEISIGLIVTFTALVMMRRLGESFEEKIICTYKHICNKYWKPSATIWGVSLRLLKVVVLKRSKTVWNWGIEAQQESAFQPQHIWPYGQTQVPPFCASLICINSDHSEVLSGWNKWGDKVSSD